MSAQVTAAIRMYRLNELGDCFLLTFVSGDRTSRVLIDCGSFRNGHASRQRLDQIVASIAEATGGAPLDVVVGTHQHNDHVSGFVHCEDAFKVIGVSQVWLSWLDDPSDVRAREIGKDFNNLLLRLTEARRALARNPRSGRGGGEQLSRTVAALNDALGFLGATDDATPPEIPANAVKILKRLGASKPRYLRPGRSLDLPNLPPGTVRVHVLGPPRDDARLFRKDPRKGESYDHAMVSANLMATRFLDAARRAGAGTSRSDEHYPFNDQYKNTNPTAGAAALRTVNGRYRRRTERWRTIDDDWMQVGEALALFMDRFTNNSSLVLAFELVESGKVLLFVADAQVGNWASWANVQWQDGDVSTGSLLSRTVLYKVGHHASHNATLVDVFEQMTSPDLVALIPVHKQDANIRKTNGWKMPARNLFNRIAERTQNRVLQMDDDNPAECNPKVNPARAAWKRVGIKPVIHKTYIEVQIKG
jgi:beta-lactamase superfamily II metal-dependent hydrolase